MLSVKSMKISFFFAIEMVERIYCLQFIDELLFYIDDLCTIEDKSRA